jgi:hypothetical protein|nr:MAG TPA: hypothetical protein [Caudoviricetes sp.]
MKDFRVSEVKGYEWAEDHFFYSLDEMTVYVRRPDGSSYPIKARPDGLVHLSRKVDGEPVPVGYKNLVASCEEHLKHGGEPKATPVNVKINTLDGFHWVADNYYFSMTEEKVYYTTNAGANKTYPVVMAHGMVYVVSRNNGRIYPISVGVIMKTLGMSPKPVEKSDEVPPSRGFIIGKLVNGVIRIARNPKTHQDEESCDTEMERLASLNPDVFFVKLAIRDVVVGKEETTVKVTRL